MSASQWSTSELSGFAEAAESLKLYRRAELYTDTGDRPIIEDLYVDPLPDKQILRTLLRAHTTFVIGRKGTGKSTIFQRAQHEIRKQRNAVSAYIDIKTVYESSQVDPALLSSMSSVGASSSCDTRLRQLLLYKAFAIQTLSELRSELEKQINSTLAKRLRERVFSTSKELLEGLDELLSAAGEMEFETLSTGRVVQVTQNDQRSQQDAMEAGVEAALSSSPAVRVFGSAKASATDLSGATFSYADTLMRVFDIKRLITELKTLLARFRVRQLYLFIDDFSELPEDAMRLVVDSLIAPLNNWSDETIKFKIAGYPGRIYFGGIDRTKSDEIYLDMYRLYGHADVSSMENKGIEFTRRLVDSRIRHYCKQAPEIYFEKGAERTIWRALFYATMANPRNLGNIMFYLHQFYLIYNKPISVTAISDAARRYYEEKIESYFAMARFSHETFGEKSSVFSLKELLEQLVARARELRSYKDSDITKRVDGRTFSSHFHVMRKFEGVLSTLELNFFLTKYYEMKDRDGRDVSVFALNYGMCQKYTIRYGRPIGFREARLYFVERIFDSTPIVQAYLRANQEISCERCGATYGLEQIDALKLFQMQCPACREGVCRVINLSRKYENLIRAVDSELLLPATELGILRTLHTEGKALYAATIAQELDCSYQLVGKRGRNLAQRDLVERGRDREVDRRTFSITEKARVAYFDDNNAAELDVPGEKE